LDDKGTINFRSVDEDSNRLLLSYEDFLTPTSLYAMDGATLQKQLVMQLPARFKSDGLEIRQEFAKSTDGTKIPYFLIHRKDLAMNGQNPTLLYAYGGFEVSMQPSYLTVAGKLWLERGGVYVLANIRGGGEFGPTWHQAALKENRQKAFDDFSSVAKDLIARKVTKPAHLGIQGGSNGGLLMGATFTQNPELFNAVVCQVPLLDMMRFHRLLAGASWMAEYGNPDDPKQAAYIAKYSPFQNLKADKKYPEVFFMTSTKDDRVHPGHARKMAARMADMKKPFLYFENIEGGHSASANLQQLAERQALSFVYLWEKLGPAPATGKPAAAP
jgi:prolyl oligopeptidase